MRPLFKVIKRFQCFFKPRLSRLCYRASVIVVYRLLWVCLCLAMRLGMLMGASLLSVSAQAANTSLGSHSGVMHAKTHAVSRNRDSTPLGQSPHKHRTGSIAATSHLIQLDANAQHEAQDTAASAYHARSGTSASNIWLPRHGMITTGFSSLGVGLGLQGVWGSYLGLSAAVAGLPLDVRPTISETRFTTKVRFISGQFTASYYPWRYAGRNLHVDMGMLVNGNHASLSPNLTAGQTFSFQGQTFQMPAGARFITKIKFNPVNPYFGLGWGTTQTKGFGFQMRAGVIYQGKPRVSFDTANIQVQGASPEEIGQAVAAAEEKMRADAHKYLDWMAWYPVVNFSLSYNF